jgi:O-antigen/teichoic acid export membrane protein
MMYFIASIRQLYRIRERVHAARLAAREAYSPLCISSIFGIGAAAAGATNLLLAKFLSPSDFGLFALVQALVMFGAGFVALGAGDAVQRIVCTTEQQTERIPWAAILYRITLRWICPTSLFVTMIAAVIYEWSSGIVLAAGGTMVALGSVQLAANILRAADHVLLGQLIMQLWRILLLMFVGAALVTGAILTAERVLMMLLIAGVLALTVAAWSVVIPSVRAPISPQLWQNIVGDARPFLGIGVSIAAFGYVDQMLIPLILSIDELGQYAVLWWIVGTPFVILQVGVGFALLPKIRRAGSEAEVRRTVNVYTRFAVLGTITAGALAVICTPVFVELLYSNKYATPVGLLGWLIALGSLRVLYAIPSSVLGARGDRSALQKLNRWGWISLISTAFSAWPLGTVWGTSGIAAALALGFGIRFAIAAHEARHTEFHPARNDYAEKNYLALR